MASARSGKTTPQKEKPRYRFALGRRINPFLSAPLDFFVSTRHYVVMLLDVRDYRIIGQFASDYSMNIGGTCTLSDTDIKSRLNSFHTRNGCGAPSSNWAPLSFLNSTLDLHFCGYLLVKATTLRSQIWTLCLDGNDEK